jgi:16S rRNA (guanine527-N7)-methyltransferase
MKSVSNQRIASILREYSVSTDAKSRLVDEIQVYIALLLRWNRSISLTTITDPEEIVRFHFGESLFAASIVPLAHCRLADVGSGAGFPGLPLKMLVPALDLTLIESNTRKAAFLREVEGRLALDKVHVFRGRLEEFEEGKQPAAFSLITARAFGQFDQLLAWSRAHVANSGKIGLWLGEQDAASISKNERWTWAAPARIPGSERRCILLGSPRS